jgi:hypothetical protein
MTARFRRQRRNRVPIEMAEGRRGTHCLPETGLPEGFVLPSAALTPPADLRRRGGGMAQVAHVEVTLTDVQPVARFIAAVCRADAMIRSMTKAEAAALPETVAAGVAELQSAVTDLGAVRDPAED